MTAMRILVTGGTGFIGNHVVRRLIGEGHTVRVLVRNASTAQSIKALGAEIVEGNLLQLGLVARRGHADRCGGAYGGHRGVGPCDRGRVS